MEIKRLDAIEYDVLHCAYPDGGGYYASGERADRAVLLMEEDILIQSPHSKWQENGWTLTELGQEYRKEFMRQVSAKHGHVWLTHYENDPEYWDNDDYGQQIDFFAHSVGNHNGPKCKNCGYEFCHHCKNELEIPVCTAR